MKTNQYGITTDSVIIDISSNKNGNGKTLSSETILEALINAKRSAIIVNTRLDLESFANTGLDFIICDIEE